MRIAIFAREGDGLPSFRESPRLLMLAMFRGSGTFTTSNNRPQHDVFRDDSNGREWAAAAVAIAAKSGLFGFEIVAGPSPYVTSSMKADAALDRHARILERNGGGS